MKDVAPEAFHGWLGQWVRSLEPATEADPMAFLALGLGALGHCVRAVLVQGNPVNQSLILGPPMISEEDRAYIEGLDKRETGEPEEVGWWTAFQLPGEEIN